MTEQKPRKPGTFQKGDKRINRKGRPRNFDALRALAQQIAHEVTEIQRKNKDGQVVAVDQMTVIEAIFRQWAQSKNPQLQKAFIEYAFGKVPERSEITGRDGGPVELTWRAFIEGGGGSD